MTTIQSSTEAYETWLRQQLEGDIVEKDLARKHEKMRKSAFVFLRASYWRWAETILEVCPDLADGPKVLAVGDIHIENYGTWRDADGRLAWGVNDFDEAAEMPYPLDLVRLATSALLGHDADAGLGTTASEIANAILKGYRQGLLAPQPVVLDRDHMWLRELVVVPDADRAEFWDDVTKLKAKPAPARYRNAIETAMPAQKLDFTTAPRSAGVGSLGRPRWVGMADWRGAPVVREAKALVVSAWDRAHARKAPRIRVAELLDNRFRAIDPWNRVDGQLAMRRLSPNNRKLEAAKNQAAFYTGDMLHMMGFELANVHLGTGKRADAIAADLKARKRGWLATATKSAVNAVARDFKAWKSD